MCPFQFTFHIPFHFGTENQITTDDQNAGSFGKLRRDEKKRKERKDVRIAADLPSDQVDL
jgi:hypothetical protein